MAHPNAPHQPAPSTPPKPNPNPGIVKQPVPGKPGK